MEQTWNRGTAEHRIRGPMGGRKRGEIGTLCAREESSERTIKNCLEAISSRPPPPQLGGSLSLSLSLSMRGTKKEEATRKPNIHPTNWFY